MPESVNQNKTNLVDSAVQLLRHLSPKEIEENLNLITKIRPEISKSLREVVSVPSKIISASESNGREFLSFEPFKLNEFHRCPWDDNYYSLEGQIMTIDDEDVIKKLSEPVKALQFALNEAVRTYANLYYGSDAITTVLIKEKDYCEEEDVEFLVAVLIKKSAVCDESEEINSQAVWDSIHTFKVKKCKEANANEDVSGQYLYCHAVTVLLSFENSVENLKNICLSGNLTHQNEIKAAVGEDFSNHLINIGTMIEESEGRLRNFQSIYFGRTHDIVNEMRQAIPDGFLRNQTSFREEMMSKLANRN